MPKDIKEHPIRFPEKIPELPGKTLAGRVAIVTGSTRGIGRACAEALASHGVHVVVCGKSATPQPNLPGTVQSVSREIERAYKIRTLGVVCNVRDDAALQNLVQRTLDTFGRLDIVVHNAGALWWLPLLQSPPGRYDLVHQVNARATYVLTYLALPAMILGQYGRMVTMSPPYTESLVSGRIAYCISKFGMTLIAQGLAGELGGLGAVAKNITSNALWPNTVIESYASKRYKLGSPRLWRKASILADCLMLLCVDTQTTGCALIDETYLRSQHGYSDADFVKYRCDPKHEPPPMAALMARVQAGRVGGGGALKAASGKTGSAGDAGNTGLGGPMTTTPAGTKGHAWPPWHAQLQYLGLGRLGANAHVVVVSFLRAHKRCAFLQAMYWEFARTLAWCKGESSVRVVVLQGSAAAFSAGNDMFEWATGLAPAVQAEARAGGRGLPDPFAPAHAWTGAPGAPNSPAVIDLSGSVALIRELFEFGKPLVAAVRGLAVGIGATMLLHCDFVLADDSAIFSTPFALLGLVPEASASLLLQLRCGVHANDLLIRGATWDAATALARGLISERLSSTQALAHRTAALASELARVPPEAAQRSKQIMRAAWLPAMEAAFAREAYHFQTHQHAAPFRNAIMSLVRSRRGGARL